MTFLTVHRHCSVTAAARELEVTASQVSKAISRLEASFQTPLFERTPRGVNPTAAATRMFPRLEELVMRARDLERGGDTEELYTLAAPSYLCSGFLGAIVGEVEGSRVRLLEAGPAQIRAFAGENLFQIALTFGQQQLTAAWIGSEVGEIRSGLFTTAKVADALKNGATLADDAPGLRAHPFVLPLYHSGGEFMPGDDGCPIPRAERARGHEASTYQCALEIAAASGHLVFGPVNSAQAFVESGQLVELEVSGWNVKSALYLHVNGDRIKGPLHKRLKAALAKVCRDRGAVGEPLAPH
jgi:DNA-binding transcriptional LysR family regulator